MELPRTTQEEIKNIPVPSIDNNMDTAPQLVVMDSHIHCDSVLHKYGFGTWAEYLRVNGDDRVEVDTTIYSCNFPSHWLWCGKISQHPNMYTTVGLHPHATSSTPKEDTLYKMRHFLSHKKCVGWGEMGLDYFHHPKPSERESQQEFLHTILPEVRASRRPLVIHCRGHPDQPDQARKDLIPILTHCLPSDYPVYVHCFSEDSTILKEWQAAFPGAYFGLGKQLPPRETLLQIPLDKLLLESDGPYQFNDSSGLLRTSMTLSKTYNLSRSMIGELSIHNGRQFFRL